MASIGVDEHHVSAVLSKISVSKSDESLDDTLKIFTALGQQVFVPWRMLAISLPDEEAMIDEIVEATRQSIRSDLKTTLEIVKSLRPFNRIAKDQYAPLIANALERLRDWASYICQAFPFHANSFHCQIRLVTFIKQVTILRFPTGYHTGKKQ